MRAPSGGAPEPRAHRAVWTGDDEYAGAAKSDGLSVYQGNPTEDATSDAPSELDEVQYALAMSDDEALNATIATDLSEYFGRDRVFQLPPKDDGTGDFYTRTTVLFDGSATMRNSSRNQGRSKITVTEAPANRKKGTGDGAGGAADLPMFVLTPGKDLQVIAAGDHPTLGSGQELIGLVKQGGTPKKTDPDPCYPADCVSGGSSLWRLACLVV